MAMPRKPGPPSSNRSIRLTDEAWSWLTAKAAERGESVNALVGSLVDRARLPPTPSNPTLDPPRSIPLANAIRDAVPPKPAAKPFKSRLKGEWKAP